MGGLQKKKKKNRSFQFLLFHVRRVQEEVFRVSPKTDCGPDGKGKSLFTERSFAFVPSFDDRKPTVGSPANGKRENEIKAIKPVAMHLKTPCEIKTCRRNT